MVNPIDDHHGAFVFHGSKCKKTSPTLFRSAPTSFLPADGVCVCARVKFDSCDALYGHLQLNQTKLQHNLSKVRYDWLNTGQSGPCCSTSLAFCLFYLHSTMTSGTYISTKRDPTIRSYELLFMRCVVPCFQKFIHLLQSFMAIKI